MTVLRTYARYAVPLTLLAVIAFSPVLLLALRVGVPPNAAVARETLRGTGVLAGLGLLPLLVLVGGAAAALDAQEARGRQLAMLRAGFARMVRAVVPCGAAMLAIGVGALALAVPGVLLLGLLSLAGASTARGVGPALAESVAAVRARPGHIALVLGCTLVVASALLLALQLALPLPLPKQPLPAQLAAFRTYVRIAIGALTLLAPLPALALATARRT